ncbi:MAG: Lrp/AsnC family transcriptional regulator [Gammaproteobacteria bacterium]|nr:Lrp/AsnC family transcriptional regulator [Gammaproteobacteria bacterium]
MDRIDYAILRILQYDGRITIQALARKVGLSPSPCLRRVRLLERAGTIRGYAAVVDERQYGLSITAFLRVRLDRHSDERVARFEKAVNGIDEVLECHVLAGDFDYMLRILVADLQAYESFIRKHIHTIPGIAAIETAFAYGTIKRSSVLPGVVEAPREGRAARPAGVTRDRSGRGSSPGSRPR